MNCSFHLGLRRQDIDMQKCILRVNQSATVVTQAVSQVNIKAFEVNPQRLEFLYGAPGRNRTYAHGFGGQCSIP